MVLRVEMVEKERVVLLTGTKKVFDLKVFDESLWKKYEAKVTKNSRDY